MDVYLDENDEQYPEILKQFRLLNQVGSFDSLSSLTDKCRAYFAEMDEEIVETYQRCSQHLLEVNESDAFHQILAQHGCSDFRFTFPENPFLRLLRIDLYMTQLTECFSLIGDDKSMPGDDESMLEDQGIESSILVVEAFVKHFVKQ